MDGEAGLQVEIETKFEVQEGALDETTFDWQHSFGNPMPEVDPTTECCLYSRGRPLAIYEKNFIGNTRTLASAHFPVV